jgi:hypothetical protein
MALEMVALELGKIEMSIEHRMKAVRKWFIVAVAACVSLGVVIATICLTRGEERFFLHPKLTEFYVCLGPDPITGLPQKPATELPSTTEKVYACGYLEAFGPVSINFLLFYEGKPLRWLGQRQNYRTGYVMKEVPRFWQEPGDYGIEAWLNRQKLASATFTIVPW